MFRLSNSKIVLQGFRNHYANLQINETKLPIRAIYEGNMDKM